MATAEIRLASQDDAERVLALYPLAFPDEDLTGLVAELLAHSDVVSLVATADDRLIAHAAFSHCGSTANSAKLVLLGPIAVHPNHQRDGLGKALIEAGARHHTDVGFSEMLVLGDPDYYQHRGFDTRAGIAPPYPLKSEWAEAWRSRLLSGDARATGTLTVPQPWQQAALWG